MTGPTVILARCAQCNRYGVTQRDDGLCDRCRDTSRSACEPDQQGSRPP